jgi:ABC-2 type transport system permease protein
VNGFRDMLWVEGLKARRSRLPGITALGFLAAPLAIGLLMYVAMHPEFARDIGLLRAKADLAIGATDWPTYLGILAQAVAAGGMLLFSLAQSWLFGREYVDGTFKDLLATPTSRSAVIAAKLVVWLVWCLGLTAVVFLGGLMVGTLLGLPGGSPAVFISAAVSLAGTAVLTALALVPIAWLACVGQGYLLPVGVTFAFLASAQVAAVLGWGAYYPWSIPALYSGAQTGVTPTAGSYFVVLATALAGAFAVDWWWKHADHHK